MTFAQPLPWWGLLVALVAIAVVAWRAGWSAGGAIGPPATVGQRTALVALRVLTLLALLAMLMRPVQLAPDPSARGTFAVLIDVSRSMALTDADGRSRLQAAQQFVQDRIAPALGDRLALDVLAFGDDVQSVQPEGVAGLAPTSATTNVARALDALRRRATARPVAGALVLSDGGFALPEPDRVTSQLDAPVYALGFGTSSVVRDREVRQVTAGDASVTGAMIDLTATVVSAGFGAAPVEVRLLASGRPVEVRRVTPAGEGLPTDVVFRVAPDAHAATLYRIEAVAQPGELTADNNSRTLLVPPPGRRRRVLLLEGAPGFEHSFLKRALDQDSALDLDAVVRKGANEAGEQTFYVQAVQERGRTLTSGFPASRQALFAYDAVVLANVDTDSLTADQLALLAEFVGERGGGLLVLGARSFKPEAAAGTVFEELLPLEISARRASDVVRAELVARASGSVALTPDGERHPVMRLGATVDQTRTRWASVPPLPSTASVGGPRPGATVLAFTSGPGGATRPLVAVQRYGRGRVLAFAGEAAWRWRMMLPSTDVTYPTFWRQAARWLAASTPDPVAIRTRSTGAGQIETTLDVRDENARPVRDAEIQLQIRGADGNLQSAKAVPDRDTNGTYVAEVRVPAGVTRIDATAVSKSALVGRATTWALAGPDENEMVEPRRNDAQLARLAQRFGGRLIAASDISDVIGEVSAQRSAAAARIERDLWHHPVVLVALLMLLVSEWALRRKWGLR